MNKEFLGRGWRFPVTIDPATGKIAMAQYEDDIKQSIHIILSTSRGERVMRPEFGCGIKDYVFSVINFAQLALLENEVKRCLIHWEPRIEVLDVKATYDGDTGMLTVNIDYDVKATNSRGNLVYPFFIKES